MTYRQRSEPPSERHYRNALPTTGCKRVGGATLNTKGQDQVDEQASQATAAAKAVASLYPERTFSRTKDEVFYVIQLLIYQGL